MALKQFKDTEYQHKTLVIVSLSLIYAHLSVLVFIIPNLFKSRRALNDLILGLKPLLAILSIFNSASLKHPSNSDVSGLPHNVIQRLSRIQNNHFLQRAAIHCDQTHSPRPPDILEHQVPRLTATQRGVNYNIELDSQCCWWKQHTVCLVAAEQ